MTPARLTRRDVAALRLALECLRLHVLREEARDALDSAEKALELPLWAPNGIANSVREAVVKARSYAGPFGDRPDRLLRARLALLIRCLLRVHEGDYGPPVCQCGRPMVQAHPMPDGLGYGNWSYAWADECVSADDEEHTMLPHHVWVGRINPLWSQAREAGK